MKPPSFEQIAAVLQPLIRIELSKLAAAHPDSSFYGVALDCNVDYGDVYVSANTEAALRAHCLEKYVRPDRTLEKAMSDLKWALGDWTYYCINAESDEWANQWRPIAQQIETYLFELNDDDDEASDWHEQFLETMCRILVSLENENAFDILRRDPDFRLCCADHDESLEDGAARMQRVRESE
jgi:hypothetical protein